MEKFVKAFHTLTCAYDASNPGQRPGFGLSKDSAGIDGQGPLTPPLTIFES